MIGVSSAVEKPKDNLAQVNIGNVAEELKTFGKEGKYLATHYVHTRSNF